MATEAQHFAQAEHNEAFLGTFDLATSPYLDWAVSVIFYAALHYLRALMARHRLTNISKYGEMDNAFARLLPFRRQPEVYQDYRQLKDDSRAARYDMWRPHVAEIADLRDQELTRIRVFVRTELGR